jgi:hypothetical protein
LPSVGWRTGQSGAPPDSIVHVQCAISFLFWHRRPLQSRGSWRTRHCPVHTGQSGSPCQPLARATRRPRIARPTVALAAVGSPDSPVNYSRTPPNSLESGLFTGVQPGAWTLSGAPPDSPVCQTEQRFGCTEPSLLVLFFSLFLALRQNMLVLKTMY